MNDILRKMSPSWFNMFAFSLNINKHPTETHDGRMMIFVEQKESKYWFSKFLRIPHKDHVHASKSTFLCEAEFLNTGFHRQNPYVSSLLFRLVFSLLKTKWLI